MNNISILFFLLFLIHCTSEPTTQQETSSVKRDNKKQKTDPKRDSQQSKNSIFIVNNTNESLSVTYNSTVPKKQSMSPGDCLSFHKKDLQNLKIIPQSICSWTCTPDLMGCKKCPSKKGYYKLLRRSHASDPSYKKISEKAPDEEDCPSFPP